MGKWDILGNDMPAWKELSKFSNLLFSILLLCIGSLFCGKSEYFVSTPSGLYMRSGPGQGYAAVKLLPVGENLEILDLNGPPDDLYGLKSNWCRVRTKNPFQINVEGWAFCALIKNRRQEKLENIHLYANIIGGVLVALSLILGRSGTPDKRFKTGWRDNVVPSGPIGLLWRLGALAFFLGHVFGYLYGLVFGLPFQWI